MSHTPPTKHHLASDRVAQRAAIVVGIAGGIAAYKTCHVIRALTKNGHDVTVIPTANALKFVGQATLEALSHNPVTTSVFENIDTVRHVAIGQRADLIVVAPATADVIAKIAHGRADDMLCATILTATCPVVLFPAMHTEMWLNPATVDNVALLRRRGITVIDPASGQLTGTDSGPGRLPEPDTITAFAELILATGPLPRTLAHKHVVVTAGGTREAIDPVRYIGNASSGKQGFAIADVAAAMGAQVDLIAGHTDALPTPPGVHRHDVDSATEMHAAVNEHAAHADLIVMAAAVADMRPAHPASTKLKKTSDKRALEAIEMIENPDILAGLVADRVDGVVKKSTVIVGFAAETGSPEVDAVTLGRQKLARKGCDVLVMNDVSEGKVFGRDTNEVIIMYRDGSDVEVPRSSKYLIARRLLEGLSWPQ